MINVINGRVNPRSLSLLYVIQVVPGVILNGLR